MSLITIHHLRFTIYDLRFTETMTNPVFNSFGRFRSGWRFLFYILAYIGALTVISGVAVIILTLMLGKEGAEQVFYGRRGYLFQGILSLAVASFVGWLCGAFLEGLPFKALGWSLHRGWLKDLIVGSVIGALSVALAILIIKSFGGYRFSFNQSASFASMTKTVFYSLVIFVLAAAAEETAFRGYGLQTMARSNIKWAWLSIVLLSLAFGFVHLRNPNVSFGFTFINTALAGIWLSVAYLKTRSLWFPLGAHWAWNWTMAAIFGIPVSGISTITPAPLFKVEIGGPTWLSGGSYGVEGGIACAVAVLFSTAAIWFLPTVKPTEEMYALTSKENPLRERAIVNPPPQPPPFSSDA